MVQRPLNNPPSKSRAPSEFDAGLPVKKRHTTYKARVELTQEAIKLYKRTRPRPQSASRAVWGQWEERKDRVRTERAVSVMCSRADDKELGRYTQNTALPFRKRPQSSTAYLTKKAEDRKDDNMRQQAQIALQKNAAWESKQIALKHYEGRHSKSKQRPCSAMPSRSPTKQSAGNQARKSRPTSAIERSLVSGRPKSPVGLKHSYMDVANKTLDVPNQWQNAASVSYDIARSDLIEEQPVVVRPNYGLGHSVE